MVHPERYELRHEKTRLRGIRPGPTQAMYSHKQPQKIEISDLGSTVYVAKTKDLRLYFHICKMQVSHDMAPLIYHDLTVKNKNEMLSEMWIILYLL